MAPGGGSVGAGAVDGLSVDDRVSDRPSPGFESQRLVTAPFLECMLSGCHSRSDSKSVVLPSCSYESLPAVHPSGLICGYSVSKTWYIRAMVQAFAPALRLTGMQRSEQDGAHPRAAGRHTSSSR